LKTIYQDVDIIANKSGYYVISCNQMEGWWDTN
jgi:hypothetical protein